MYGGTGLLLVRFCLKKYLKFITLTMKCTTINTYQIRTALGGFLFASLLLFAFVLPVQAQVQTTAETTTQATTLANLEKMIKDLMAQIVQLQKDTAPSLTTPSGVCIELSRTLKLGSTDANTEGEVGKLQRYLTNTGHYTHGSVTGFYGVATERAVQNWQRTNGVVTSGTPATTGYGVFGQNTREKMKSGCVPQSKAYTLTDVKSVTKKSVDPMPMAIDDEYTLYTVTLNSGKVHTFKKGFSPFGAFENQVKATGYTGDIPALLALATTISTSYGIDDVASVRLDSSKTLFDGPAVYTIKLRSGAQVIVSVCVSRGCTQANIDTAFKDSGYTGDIPKLIALAKKARVCTNERRTYQEGETRSSSSIFTANKYLSSDRSYVCRNGSWEVVKKVASSTQELGVIVAGRIVTAKFSLTNGCQGYAITWGDGTAEDKVAASTQLACTLAITEVTRVHTYAKAGRYTVTLNLLQNTGAPKIYSKTVIVGSTSASGLFQSN